MSGIFGVSQERCSTETWLCFFFNKFPPKSPGQPLWTPLNSHALLFHIHEPFRSSLCSAQSLRVETACHLTARGSKLTLRTPSSVPTSEPCAGGGRLVLKPRPFVLEEATTNNGIRSKIMDEDNFFQNIHVITLLLNSRIVLTKDRVESCRSKRSER